MNYEQPMLMEAGKAEEVILGAWHIGPDLDGTVLDDELSLVEDPE